MVHKAFKGCIWNVYGPARVDLQALIVVRVRAHHPSADRNARCGPIFKATRRIALTQLKRLTATARFYAWLRTPKIR